jgi:hypothetical protein
MKDIPTVNTSVTTEPEHAPHRSDAAYVDWFAGALKLKLAKKQNEGRRGWNDPNQVTIDQLKEMLVDHVEKGDMLDVGNLAMMIWYREMMVRLDTHSSPPRDYFNIWVSNESPPHVYGYKCTCDGGKTWAYSLDKKCRYCLPVYDSEEVRDKL